MAAGPPDPGARHQKLARIPKSHKVTKRPLAKPAIPSKYAAYNSTKSKSNDNSNGNGNNNSDGQKRVYISARTPFMSAIKRVQNLLRHVEKRAVQSASDLSSGAGTNQQSRKRKADALDPQVTAARLAADRLRDRARGVSDEVAVRASGRAIERVLAVGRWFEQKEGYRIAIRTGTVKTVDDIERLPERDDEVVTEDMDLNSEEEEEEEEEEEVAEARIRHVSYVEVAVALA